MENVNDAMKDFFLNRQVEFEKLIQETLDDLEVREFLKENKLSDEEIQRSYSKLFEFVREKKKYEENDHETQFASGYRPRLIMNHHYVDVSYQPTQETIAREKMRLIQSRIQTMNIPKDVRIATMQEIYTTPNRQGVFYKMKEFLSAYQTKEYHKGLYIYGSFGIGKTYILGAIANELAKNGTSTTMLHFPTFAEEMKDAINEEGLVKKKLDSIKKVEILMLDDIGAETMSAWIRDSILGIILEYRMQEQLPTFFTSNQSFEKLEEHLSFTSKGDIEPLKAKRLMERVRYLAQEVKMDGKNLRN